MILGGMGFTSCPRWALVASIVCCELISGENSSADASSAIRMGSNGRKEVTMSELEQEFQRALEKVKELISKLVP